MQKLQESRGLSRMLGTLGKAMLSPNVPNPKLDMTAVVSSDVYQTEDLAELL